MDEIVKSSLNAKASGRLMETHIPATKATVFTHTPYGECLLSRLAASTFQPKKRVLLLDADDERVIDAANKIASMDFVVPVTLNQSDRLAARVEVFMGLPDRDKWLDHCAKNAIDDGIFVSTSLERLGRIELLNLGAALLNAGYVDGAIAGAVAKTADVLKSGIRGVGLTQTRLVSSYFLMLIDEHIAAFADCAVIPEPTPEQLSQIAIETASNFQLLTGAAPAVAFLSFSTLGSASHGKIEKVKKAVALTNAHRPDLEVDGELQFDAAYVASVAKRKAPDSTVAGRANVFIFPDLQSGNIAYKVAERIGRVKAIGPVLQGLNKPWMDLSRGCSTDDIVDLTLLSACIACGKSVLTEPALALE